MTAIGLLLTGAALNDRRGEQVYKDGGIYCYVIKPGVFAVGAVLSALSSIFGVFYYQTLNSKAKDASNAPIPNQVFDYRKIDSPAVRPTCASLKNLFGGCIGMAIGLLLTGAALNDRRGEQVYKDGGIYCYVIKPGVFAVGAVLSALSSIFGVFYYQTLNSKAKDASNAPIPNQGGIVTAQPQFPSENPGFVNGDAYNKRQFN
ncbi:hypothetical protein GOBAR_AA19327 [Gossypium barbadense]|uniref:Uncharacterized protein n=1 Tax=Gossypium barbadense TaxID=3634 RepID=A0A2P5XDC6_GOSBA|nr:hypothetical protein GOBAR_AA19327 [Gossypium barbadense]